MKRDILIFAFIKKLLLLGSRFNPYDVYKSRIQKKCWIKIYFIVFLMKLFSMRIDWQNGNVFRLSQRKFLLYIAKKMKSRNFSKKSKIG